MEPFLLVPQPVKLVMRSPFRLTGCPLRFEFVDGGQLQFSGVAALRIRVQTPLGWVFRIADLCPRTALPRAIWNFLDKVHVSRHPGVLSFFGRAFYISSLVCGDAVAAIVGGGHQATAAVAPADTVEGLRLGAAVAWAASDFLAEKAARVSATASTL
jgi:hypothetical protein